MTDIQTLEILDALKNLPPEKVAEVRDFAFFLRERYGENQKIDENDEWTEEDLHDITAASLSYLDEADK